MIIKNVRIVNFRNLGSVEFSCDPEINIFCGSNAQGKTNILEAVCVGSVSGSFRNARDQEMIKNGEDNMKIEICFNDKRRSQIIDYSVEIPSLQKGIYENRALKNKNVRINGAAISVNEIKERMLECVVFTPDDLIISKGSPEKRRNYIDSCISQMKKSYKSMTEKYCSLLEQRNSQLKLIAYKKSEESMLDLWDTQIAECGGFISMMRYIYCKNINKFTSRLYSEMTGGSEIFDIKYHSSVFKDLEGRKDVSGDLAIEYLNVLKANRKADIDSGLTLKGIHRDDVQFYINQEYARKISSQGQHRSMTLSLKLAHAYMLNEIMNEPPVILLDDILSELDMNRQEFVLKKISGMQVFITCCDENLINIDSSGKKFFIKNGNIIKTD